MFQGHFPIGPHGNKSLPGNIVHIGPNGQVVPAHQAPGLPTQRPTLLNSLPNQMRHGNPQLVMSSAGVPGQPPHNLNATLQASQALILQQQQQLAAVQQQQLAIQQQQQQQQQQIQIQQQQTPNSEFDRRPPNTDLKYSRSNDVRQCFLL